jgi:hypothetical protein
MPIALTFFLGAAISHLNQELSAIFVPHIWNIGNNLSLNYRLSDYIIFNFPFSV